MSSDVQPVVTRFAPSPTGLLHLGSAYSALIAWTRARDAGGRPIPEDELIDELRTLIIAGHETTATTLGWALLTSKESLTGAALRGEF